MRSRETLVRLHRFRTEDKRRQAADIEAMIADLLKKFDELDGHVKFEEGRSGVTDPNHFNYSMAAKAARTRRDNLMKSIADLRDQHEAALGALADEEAELRKVELLVEKESAMVQTALPAAHGENGFAHAR